MALALHFPHKHAIALLSILEQKSINFNVAISKSKSWQIGIHTVLYEKRNHWCLVLIVGEVERKNTHKNEKPFAYFLKSFHYNSAWNAAMYKKSTSPASGRLNLPKVNRKRNITWQINSSKDFSRTLFVRTRWTVRQEESDTGFLFNWFLFLLACLFCTACFNLVETTDDRSLIWPGRG